jgi:hypothetical protein
MDLDPEDAVAMRAMWVGLDLDAKKAMLTDDDPEKVRLAIKAWDVLLEMKDWGWEDDDEHGHPHGGEDGDPEVPEGALPAQDRALIPLLIARMTLSDETLAEVNAGGLPREVIASTMEDPTAPKYIRPDAGGTLNSLVRVYGGEALAEVLRVVHADLAIAEADPTQWHAKERAIYTLGTVVSICGLKDRGVEAFGDGIAAPLGPLGGGSARSVWGPKANVPDVERMLTWLHDEHWLIRASAAWTLSMCSWLLSPLKDFGNGPDPSTAPFQKVISSFLDYIRVVVEAEERETEGKEGKEGKEGILGVGGGGGEGDVPLAVGDAGKAAMSEKNPFHLFMVCTVIDTLIGRRGVGALLARDHLRSMVGACGGDDKGDMGSNGGHASLLGGLVWAIGALWRLDVPFVSVFDAIQGTLHNGSLHEKVCISSFIVYPYTESTRVH